MKPEEAIKRLKEQKSRLHAMGREAILREWHNSSACSAIILATDRKLTRIKRAIAALEKRSHA